jgi:hypothetical protein
MGIHTYIHTYTSWIVWFWSKFKKNKIIHGLWNPVFDLLVPLSWSH